MDEIRIYRPDLLRTLIVVAESGSINRASSKLLLTQPAISRSIRIAEDELGLPLFERRHSGVRPTAHGYIFIARAQRALGHLAEAEATRTSSRLNTASPARTILKRGLIKQRHLNGLITMAEIGDVAAAANHLGISRNGLYRSLRELGDILGYSIFEHRNSRIALTNHSEALFRHAKLFFSEMRHARDELNAQQGVMSGTIAIGTLPLSRTWLVPRAITDMTERYPEVSFTLTDGPYNALLTALRCGDIDLIVGALRRNERMDELSEETLFQDTLSIVAGCNHPLAKNKRVTFGELAAAKWILPRQGTPTRHHFELIFRRARKEPPGAVVECSSLVAIRSLLLDNDWITIMSHSQVRYEEEAGSLVLLNMSLPQTSRPIGVTTRADGHFPPAIVEFINTLRKLAPMATDRAGRSNRATPKTARPPSNSAV